MLAQAGCDIETRGRFAFMITKERFDELLDYNPETGVFTWKVNRSNVMAGTDAGTPHSHGYWTITIARKQYLGHRLAFLAMTGEFPSDCVDHINGDPSDNRWANLRPATRQENNCNKARRTDNRSGAIGVSWDSVNNKWLVNIAVGGVSINLGRFLEFEDAVAARRAAEIKYHGEFSAAASRVDDRSCAC